MGLLSAFFLSLLLPGTVLAALPITASGLTLISDVPAVHEHWKGALHAVIIDSDFQCDSWKEKDNRIFSCSDNKNAIVLIINTHSKTLFRYEGNLEGSLLRGEGEWLENKVALRGTYGGAKFSHEVSVQGTPESFTFSGKYQSFTFTGSAAFPEQEIRIAANLNTGFFPVDILLTLTRMPSDEQSSSEHEQSSLVSGAMGSGTKTTFSGVMALPSVLEESGSTLSSSGSLAGSGVSVPALSEEGMEKFVEGMDSGLQGVGNQISSVGKTVTLVLQIIFAVLVVCILFAFTILLWRMRHLHQSPSPSHSLPPESEHDVKNPDSDFSGE